MKYSFETEEGKKSAEKAIKEKIDNNVKVIKERVKRDRIKIQEAEDLLNSLIC